MVPSFGGFVSATGRNCYLVRNQRESEKEGDGERGKKRNKNEPPNGFDDAVAGRRVCARFVAGSIVAPRERRPSHLLKVGD